MYLILIFQTETSRYPLGQQTYSRRFAGSTWCYPGVNMADLILCTMGSCSINVCRDAGRLVFVWALPSERVRPRRVLRAGAGQAWRSRDSFRHAWELSENKELWSWASVSSRNDAHSAHDTNYQDYSMVVRRENGSPAQLTRRGVKRMGGFSACPIRIDQYICICIYILPSRHCHRLRPNKRLECLGPHRRW